MGQLVAVAQDVLSEFVQAHRRWHRFLAAGPDGQTNGDIAAMLEQLDAAGLTLHELHAANEQANDGDATIPTKAEFEANLALAAMRDRRRELAERRRHAENQVDELGAIVTDDPFLAEFDDLPPVERLAFLNELLTHADAILELEADKAVAKASSSSHLQRRQQDPSVLADIGDQHLLSPARIEELAADLPLQFTRDPTGGHGASIVAASSGERRKIESQVEAAMGVPPSPATTAAWKLAAQYGNLVNTLAPVLAAARDRAAADDALVALYGHLTPFLGTTSTPGQVRHSLESTRESLSEVDRDFFLKIELPLGAALGGLDIYLALSSFFANPSAGSALQDAATAVLKAAELMLGAVDEMEAIASRTAAGVALRIAGVVTALGLLVLDLKAAESGISSAVRHRDYSVAVGEVLKAGSALLFSYSAIAVALGASATTGPLFFVVAIGVALVLIGEALVAWTQDTELEKFAAVCAFGVNPATSDDPGDVEYRFRSGQAADIPVQLARLRTLFNPLGFTIGPPSGGLQELSHSRPTSAGPVELRLPAATTITVSLVEPDGSTTEWASTGLVPFDPDRFRTEGQAFESEFHNRGVVGRWMEMEAVLPGTGEARSLREYAEIP